MSLENVKKELESKNADIKIFRLDDSGATVDEAAETIGVDGDEIAKTLALHLNDEVIIIVMSGNSRIDNKKYRDTFHAKAKMLIPEEVEPLTGHPVGGLCPFGLNGSPKIFLDKSIEKHEFVYPAAGSPFYAFKIATDTLEKLTEAKWVDISKE
jgi:prolyl-tRNA editing enzyme YbaK/EbsC (Cys-tRNA(Pro) deacylase)